MFVEEKLFGTLPEKESQLKYFEEQRKAVTEREPKIDEFVDKGHALYNSTDAKKIKPLVSQISNRHDFFQF